MNKIKNESPTFNKKFSVIPSEKQFKDAYKKIDKQFKKTILSIAATNFVDEARFAIIQTITRNCCLLLFISGMNHALIEEIIPELYKQFGFKFTCKITKIKKTMGATS